MNDSVIVWDLETIPDLQGFAAANYLVGKTDAEIREVMGDKFPKHIYHSIVCIGALIAHREDDKWLVDAIGAPHIGERSEKELVQAFVGKIADLKPQLVTFNGNSFDLPVLRYRAMVHSVAAPGLSARPYFNRYTDDAIDLCDVLSSFASQAKATLNEICKVMGMQGKPESMHGGEVARYCLEGRIKEVADYCETDIVNTYRVWLRYELFRGRLTNAGFEASEANLVEFIQLRGNTRPHPGEDDPGHPQYDTPASARSEKGSKPSKEGSCLKIFYSPSYTIAAYSFDTTRKSQWIAESLAREPIVGIELVAPEPTSAAALSRVHDPKYVDAVRTGKPLELAQSQGFTWDPALWEMVCASNGGVIDAAIEALRTRSVSGSLSSGLHHARQARGKGFCTFNGLVLAAHAALDAGARTVLILDLDAHCGGGTHELIHGDGRIWQMDVSVNTFDRYEPLGNNQLEMVHDGSRYLPTIERKLTWLEREAPRFDICLYNAGMDPFEGCSIGGMQGVTQNVLHDREVAAFSWCRMWGVPIAFVLAGGYIGRELERAGLVTLHRLTLEAACGRPGRDRETQRQRTDREPDAAT